jgi:hypothetical protein
MTFMAFSPKVKVRAEIAGNTDLDPHGCAMSDEHAQ